MSLQLLPPPELRGHAEQLLGHIITTQDEHMHPQVLELSELALERVEGVGWVEPVGYIGLVESIIFDIQQGQDVLGNPMPEILRQPPYSPNMQRKLLIGLGSQAFGPVFADKMLQTLAQITHRAAHAASGQ